MPEPVAKPRRQDLVQTLWPAAGPPASIWAILDCARDQRIYGAIERLSLERCPLFAGALPPELKRLTPQLVRLGRNDPFTNFVLDNGWGNAWGIFVRSSAGAEALRRHFRTFLRVQHPDGRHVLFRYYDPRVLRVFLPTCQRNELSTVFGSVVDSFFVEAEIGSGIVRYRFDGQSLM